MPGLNETPYGPITPTPFQPAAPDPTAVPTPDPHEAWRFGSIDFADSGNSVTMVVGGTVTLNAFFPYQWTPTALDDGIFDVGKGTGLAFADDFGRVGVWLHSGDDQTASQLQLFLEREPNGFRKTALQTEEILASLINVPVFIAQDGHLQPATIVAAGRVPPLGVDSMTPHVADLIEYMAQTYPNRGFELLEGRRDVLTIIFCGLRLVGEESDPAVSFFRQARFVISMVPDG